MHERDELRATSASLSVELQQVAGRSQMKDIKNLGCRIKVEYPNSGTTLRDNPHSCASFSV